MSQHIQLLGDGLFPSRGKGAGHQPYSSAECFVKGQL